MKSLIDVIKHCIWSICKLSLGYWIKTRNCENISDIKNVKKSGDYQATLFNSNFAGKMSVLHILNTAISEDLKNPNKMELTSFVSRSIRISITIGETSLHQ